jgi:16S rRNA (adenine1518-N6/adenine1519-N6)-dimethyltransferase
MNVNRQTASYLQKRLEQVGIHPDTRRGQNFLVDLNLLDVLVREADIRSDQVVLEVGTGTGSLTAPMAERAAAVVTVEVDPQLYQLASEELVSRENVIMLKQDALRNKNNVDPHVLDTVAQQVDAHQAAGYKLVANLPYSIATPLISNLLLVPRVPLAMTVTIQKELADRITARPSTKDYGALSVWVQSLCDAEIVRVLPPSVFWPRPKVSSAFLRIIPRPDKRSRYVDLGFFHRFVRSLFFHRRKFLRSVLISATKNELSKGEVDDILAQLQLPGDCRAEQLDAPAIHALAEAVRQRVNRPPKS